jgi:hypothetical protein
MLRRVDDGRRDGVCLWNLAGLTDNHNEAPATTRLHQGYDLPCQLPNAKNFSLEMPQQGLAGHLIDAAGQMRAGIAHHNIDAAESLSDTADQGGNVFRLA